MNLKVNRFLVLVFALLSQLIQAQEKTISGLVSDGNTPIPGANIVVKGTNKGVSAGFDGRYSLKANQGDVLVFSFMGMQTVSRTVATSNEISVVMRNDDKELAEIVVQGYRTVTKKNAATSSATISRRTIENRPNANVLNTIQGQLAGVNVSAGSGQPGAKPTIIIRGLGTLNGNSDPLYVIDGFPSNSDNFRSINSNDIESFSVLKDAAAIAEFGSRGSNGVIVIKTKTGVFGEPKNIFRYSSTFGTNQLQKPKYSFSNSRQLLSVEKLATSLNPGISSYGSSLTDVQINAYNINTDWVDYFFTRGLTQDHTLSMENNGQKSNSFTSLGYFKQEGVLKTTGLQRFTLRNNLNGKSINDKFKYQVNTAIGHSKNNEATGLGTGGINRNYVLGAFQSAPYLSPNLYTNSYNTLYYFRNNTARVPNILPGTADLSVTPLTLIDKLLNYENLTEETRIDISTEFSYSLSKDLIAKTRTSGQLLSASFFQSEFPRSFNGLLFNPGTAANVNSGNPIEFDGFEEINKRREFYFSNLWQIAYKKNINKHTFNASLNAEYNLSRLNANNFRQNGLDKNLFVPNTGAGYVTDNTTGTNDFYVPTNVTNLNLRNDLISYFSTFDYDFNDKYGIVASFRRDGSSRFLSEYQFGNFWSVGARWNMEEENFIKNLNFIDVLKFRGSIGTVGNQRIVDGSIYAGILPPPFVTTFAAPTAALSYGPTYNASFGDSKLRWETTKLWNIGIDFEFFKGIFRGAFDVYNKTTKDQFFPDPQAPIYGAASFLRNSSAVLTNDGYELNIAYDLFKNDNKDLKFTLRGNGAYNKNMISGITANDGKIENGNFINRNGGPAFEYNVIPYTGVNPTNGNLLFLNKAGLLTETPIETDRVQTGKNFLPVYQGGFGFDFKYKGFFVSSSFTFAQEVWRFDFDEEGLYATSGIGDFNKSSDLLSSWTPTNTNSNLPKIGASNEGQDDSSDRFLRDASYIRIRNMQIGYVVPSRFLNKTFLKTVSFNLQGENLANFTKWNGFDPESNRTNDSRQYPTAKIITFGVDLKF